MLIVVKKLPSRRCKRGWRPKRREFDPWVGKIPWRRAWQPIAVSLPGESHGQGRLVGYSIWGCKELDMTEQVTHTHKHLGVPKSMCVYMEHYKAKRRRPASLGQVVGVITGISMTPSTARTKQTERFQR